TRKETGPSDRRLRLGSPTLFPTSTPLAVVVPSMKIPPSARNQRLPPGLPPNRPCTAPLGSTLIEPPVTRLMTMSLELPVKLKFTVLPAPTSNVLQSIRVREAVRVIVAAAPSEA